MTNVRIKIGDGAIEDTFTAHGLIYMDADHRTEAPIKKRDVSSYLGEPGEHVDPRTVQDAFDYKVRFIIDGQNRDLKNVNAIVAAFNRRLYTQTVGSGIRTYKEIAFYNDFKRVKIVGLPEPIAEPKEMKRSKNGYDFAEVELTIHVSDPTKCDFNMADGDGMPIAISLSTDGGTLYLKTSRPLASTQYVALLTRGRKINKKLLGSSLRYQESHFRWHVGLKINMEADGRLELPPGYAYWEPRRTVKNGHAVVLIKKASSSDFIIPAERGRKGKVCYGIAVVQSAGSRIGYKRLSNVCYFRSNVSVGRIYGDSLMELHQWITV